MSKTTIGRAVRPALLLVAGMLLGQGALALAASPVPAATVQTRVSSCAGFGFRPINSETGYNWDNREVYRRSNKGDGWFMCPVDLPHRAVVTRVRFTISDTSEYVGFEYCGLVRSALAPTGTIQVVGLALSGISTDAQPGTKRYGTTAIHHATVDN